MTVKDAAADDAAVSFFKAFCVISFFGVIFTGEFFNDLGFELLEVVSQFSLGVRFAHHVVHRLAVFFYNFFNGILVEVEARNFAFRFADGGSHFVLNGDQRLDGILPENQGFDHVFFRDFF